MITQGRTVSVYAQTARKQNASDTVLIVAEA